MCGIVGLYLKNTDMQSKLGALFAPMLIAMTDRGPDSAGFAIYRNPVGENETKFTLASDDAKTDWESLASELEKKLACAARIDLHGDHAVMVTESDPQAVQNWLAEFRPTIRIVGSGRAIEIFKQTGLPKDVAEQFKLATAHGSHAIGHTRMATESAVTTEGSHPFATGLDLCLVHNGSLSNHNWVRRELEREGIMFQTENDTEVAAGYLTSKLRQGASLHEALDAGLKELDGFYTFCVGTADGFAVVRDPFACKHAVLAETDDWVAMATEYRAIAHLPGADTARIWEPEPHKIYTWGSVH
ncbi:MAG: Amidophosphoribosyltransferase [Alphaproteobacteria bacterium MarineAlpha10_Bin1]|jgi:amidophosphoribosyltransferase|nr:MAG: Amidophosphoribosyltransferase [Alphaproteobacteria bacterium MarineAlpha10_Bin1]